MWVKLVVAAAVLFGVASLGIAVRDASHVSRTHATEQYNNGAPSPPGHKSGPL